MSEIYDMIISEKSFYLKVAKQHRKDIENSNMPEEKKEAKLREIDLAIEKEENRNY